jgi:Thioredoxin
LPFLAIAAVLAATAVLGFGAGKATSQEEVDREVSELLAGIPQDGPTLGESKAPITLRVFADLECPTVRQFVVSRLPPIISTWVRKGVIRLEYRSLETDTVNERTFFMQEAAALAAGRQDRMWDFALTAVHEQQYKLTDLGQKGFSRVTGVQHVDYVDERFLTDIASRVSGLDMALWRQDREDASLSKQVARGVRLAHANDLHATPAFMIGRTGDVTYHRVGPKTERNYLINAASLGRGIEAYLGRSAAYLRQHGVPEVKYQSSKE